MIWHAHLPSTLPCLRPCLPPVPNLWLLLMLFQIAWAWFHYGYERPYDDDRGNWLANFSFDYIHYSCKELKNQGPSEPIGRIAKTSWPRRTRFKQIFYSAYRKCSIPLFIVASMSAWFDNQMSLSLHIAFLINVISARVLKEGVTIDQ